MDVLAWKKILTVEPAPPIKKRKIPSKARKQALPREEILWQFQPISFFTNTLSTLPTEISQVQQCVLNHLARVLPLPCSVMTGGVRIDFTMVAVFYRQNKLTWLLMSCTNNKIYMSSHWTSDSTHMYHSLKKNNKIHIEQDNPWYRQGFNNVCFVGPAQERLIHLLPPYIFQTKGTTYTLNKVKEFIQNDPFVIKYGRHITQAIVVPTDLLVSLMNKRMFSTTTPCDPTRCSCALYVQELTSPKTHEDAVRWISQRCPSALYNSALGHKLVTFLMPIIVVMLQKAANV